MKKRFALQLKFGSLAVRLALVALLASALLPLAGCWDIRYLDKLGVVIALGVDDDPSGKFRYELTVQVVLPQNATTGDGGGDGSPVMTITEKGDTLFEAIRKMSAKTSRRLFFSHTQLLVISDQAASREGIFPLMDLIDRNADIRTDISVVIARGVKAGKLLQIRTQMESVPANQMKEMITVDQKAKAQVYGVLVRDITRKANSEKQQVAIPAIGVEGDPDAGSTKEIVDRIDPKVLPELTTMAIFNHGKLIGYLSPNQSRGLAWSQDKVENTVVKFPCANNKGHYIMEVIHSGTKVKAKRATGDSELPSIYIQVRLDASVHEITCPELSIHDEHTLKTLEEGLDAAVEAEIQSAVEALKGRNVDVMGWGEQIYRDQPAAWRKLKTNWKSVFPRIEYEIECISHVDSMGARTDAVAN
ncbi:Ger(x)C family spore germination protein [Paenibacillus sp. LHD-117]|uniref:Ger(x)C family spore germination protein n=1 Tax=Paenibacillus sp. LHD-117 TaxID=3071412 RepID=UPI0027DF6FE8|nr:Ger(x)C family spore germination protein [Paenibacillus sp. LHD-117]MDQ6420963.1 Ger(x)C family spore germination protein [Paenibacillus sp. LHD-117]